MAESSRRYNLRDTRKKPQGVLLKRWEVEYSKLISNENRRIPLETIKIAIQSAFEDGMFEQWRITLKCPLSGQRIKIPARYADCTHIECFDLEAFLRMKTQKNLLVCPVCQKEVEKPLTNLRIDKYIETVLSTLPDAMQVELLPDGSFTEVHAEFVSVPNVINDEEPYVQDSNMPSFNVKQEALEDDDDYITLSDGEDFDMEEITIVDMKPISLMPLNMDIKPKITSSSEPEQIHSQEDQEIQDQHNAATQNADIYENDQNCSTGSAAIIQFNVKTEPEVVGTSETEILGTIEVRKRKAPSKFAGLTSQTSGAIVQQNVETEGESSNLRPMKHAKTDLELSETNHGGSNEIECEIDTDIDHGVGQTSDESMDSTLNGHNVLTGDGTEETSAKYIIPKRAWLEALKHLTCLQWSKIRLVSRKLNGLIEKNVSCLPMAIIDSVKMILKQREKTESKIIALDSIIPSEQKNHWFKDRGITLDSPADIDFNNVINCLKEFGYFKEKGSVDLIIQGDREKFNASVLFNAEFSPHRNPYSWPAMAYFLKLIYDQSTFVKELLMLGLDKKLKGNLIADEKERYIRCGSFAFQCVTLSFASVVDLCQSLSWLEQNVQADVVQFPKGIHYHDSKICDAISKYLLGSSWISASQVVNLAEIGTREGNENDIECFFETLIEKFPTVAVESIFPTLVFRGNRSLCCDSLSKQLSGKCIAKEKLKNLKDDSDDSQSDEIYRISNGSNRMRIKFIRQRLKRKKLGGRKLKPWNDDY